MNSARFRLAAALAVPTMVLAACGGQGGSSSTASAAGEVRVDGSSTVGPLTAAAGELFNASPDGQGINVSVGQSGTGGGFKKFCAGETDISDASREIKPEEAKTCADAGIKYGEIIVANDALTVVVNKENDWAKCLTVKELNTIWAPESEGKVTNWNQVRDGFPDVPMELFGPGTDSGTFDYFTAAINGTEGASRTDYGPSEDDNVTVTGVEGTKGAMGYFGYSYFEENQDRLNAVEVDNGKGCVAPSVKAAQDGSYAPLSRPLYIYVAESSMAKPYVAAFVDFYINNLDAAAKKALFIPLNAKQAAEAKKELAALKG